MTTTAHQLWRPEHSVISLNAHPAEDTLRRGRLALHELAQSVTIVAGAIDLLGLTDDDDELVVTLQASATSLVERTKRLRLVLQGL